MKQVKLKEEEHKYLIESLRKESVWEKEFIIYQWYVQEADNYEKKYKVIFDFLTLSVRYVIVEKERTDAISANKTVTYLDIKDFQGTNLLNTPFVMKRRSIIGDAHLDHFIYSNRECTYLLEIEEPSALNKVSKLLKIKEDVSKQSKFKNSRMAIPYEKMHQTEIESLLRLWK